MQTIKLLLIACLTSAYMMGQDRPAYYPSTVGNAWEMQKFDAKDKLTSTNKTRVITMNPTVSGYDLELEVENIDNKGKSTGKNNLVMKCENGIFYFDMKSFMDPATMESYKEMDIAFDATNMEMPAGLQPGTSLKDASLTMTVTNQGIKMMTITTVITNRKVESEEQITVPAGTFTAWKISYDVETKMMFKVKMHAVEYWVPGTGVVRTENYNEKGKLVDYSVMSSLSK
ncbi:MAG: hypothetical protein ABIJ16_02085 [Bacteroidota bacterium]